VTVSAKLPTVLPSTAALGKPFRVEMRLRNNRLIRAREALGYMTAKAAADALGLPYSDLVSYETLYVSPWSKRHGDWKKTAMRVAVAYRRAPEDLWPDVVRSVRRTRTMVEADVPAGYLEPPETPEEALERSETSRIVAAAVDDLPYSLAKVVRARFGIGMPEHTIEEAAVAFGICRQSVVHREELAMRALRGVGISRSRALPTLLGADGEPSVLGRYEVVVAGDWDETRIGHGQIDAWSWKEAMKAHDRLKPKDLRWKPGACVSYLTRTISATYLGTAKECGPLRPTRDRP
jgi:hypothetical protein